MSRGAAAMILLAVATGCSKPPTETLTAARTAEEAAKAAGVEEYAPTAMLAVAEARTALDAEMAAQNERWSVSRSFKKAEELATVYKQASEQAVQATEAAKEQTRLEATDLVAAGKLAVEEVRNVLATAPAGKGSRADLLAMQADLDAAGTTLMEAEASLTAGRYMEAKSQATAAREVVERVRSAVTQAQAVRAG